MSLSFTGHITRTNLGLGFLNINDGVNYSMTDRIMGGTVSWDRNQVNSPWVDGDVTVFRRRGNVTDSIGFNVYGANHGEIRNNLVILVDGFSQDEFSIFLTMDGATYQYECETADYTLDWDYKMHSNMATINFQVPRKPVAFQGI